MIYAVYRASDGALVSTTTSAESVAPDAVLASKGLAVKAIDMKPEEAGGAWDAAAKSFLPKPPDEPVPLVSAAMRAAGADKLGKTKLETPELAAEQIFAAMYALKAE